jgi:hypothetical protein
MPVVIFVGGRQYSRHYDLGVDLYTRLANVYGADNVSIWEIFRVPSGEEARRWSRTRYTIVLLSPEAVNPYVNWEVFLESCIRAARDSWYYSAADIMLALMGNSPEDQRRLTARAGVLNPSAYFSRQRLQTMSRRQRNYRTVVVPVPEGEN